MFKRKTAERIVALGLAVACGFFPINTVTKAAGTEPKIISTSQTADYEDGIIDYKELTGSLEIQKQPNTNNHEVRFGINSGNEATWTTDMLSSEGKLGSTTKMKFRLDEGTSNGWGYIGWFLRRSSWNKYYEVKYKTVKGELSIVKTVDPNTNAETTLPKTKDGTDEATLDISPKLGVSDTYHDITMSISGDAETGITISVDIDGKYQLTAYDKDGSYSGGKFGIQIVNQSACFDDLTRTCYAAEDWNTSVWSAVDTKPDLVEDSAIDLSYMNDAPSGSKGFLKIDDNGDFYFEKEPNKTVKFYGTNLNGNYGIEPSHAQTDKIVDRLSKSGYNAVRFSSIDNYESWAKGIFEKPTSTTVTVNADKLDSFDYLMFKLKEKGIYVYIDVLCSISFDGISSLSEYKLPAAALAIMTEDGMATWKSMAEKLFEHENPYTHTKYKDDPIFIGVSPFNENLISNMNLKTTDASKQLFYDGFNEYLKANGKSELTCGIDSFSFELWEKDKDKGEGLWVSYLTDKTMTKYTEMKEYLQKDLEVKAPIGGINMLDDTMIGYCRTASDVYETHSYNGLINVGSAKTYTYYPHKHTPYSKTFSQELLDNYIKGDVSNQPYSNFIPAHAVGQLYKKPFVLSEYNQQLPSKGRDQLAIISTASGAYNGWDSFLRFDFAASASATLNNIGYGQDAFNTVADPLVIATEFQGNLILRKGNITPAKTKFVVVVDKGFAQSYGSVWEGAVTPNLAYIPHLFKMETVFADNQDDAFAIYKLTDNLTPAQIAAGNIPKENKIIGYTGVRGCNNDKSLEDIAELLINSLDDTELKNKMLTNLNNNLLVTDTGELVFDIEKCVYKVNTPYVSALSGTLKGVEHKLGDVSLKADNDEGTISVSSLDDKTLNDSNRMLVVYTTDVSAAGEKYEPVENSNEVVYTRGTYPALVKIATGEVKLSNLTLPATSYKAYKLDLNGSRVAEIPVTVSGDTITVPLKTDCGYYFEIVSDENPFTVDGKTINSFSELKANDTVTANVNIAHNSTEEENVNLFLVLYDNNNRMIDASIEPLTLKPNQVSCLKTISLQLPDKIDKYHLNLMVWSDYDGGFKPLAEPKKLE